jgi:hypothetical protein
MDKIIRKWDTVKIANPELFLRCGYPMSKDHAMWHIDKKYKENILKFITDLNITGRSEKINIEDILYDNEISKTYEEICKALAYHLLRVRKFGGADRSVYTKKDETHKDRIGRVIGIKYVKSGIYVKDKNGPDGYEPAYLTNQRTHKILTVSIGFEFIEIEDRHVDKIAELKKVKFIGCNEIQINWGNHDDPNEFLSKKKTYRVFKEDEHTTYTSYKLVGYEKYRFNSICFKEV